MTSSSMKVKSSLCSQYRLYSNVGTLCVCLVGTLGDRGGVPKNDTLSPSKV
jgi:hypothetical protein